MSAKTELKYLEAPKAIFITMITANTIKAELETFRVEKLSASTLGYFSDFISQKSKIDNLAILKQLLHIMLKKDNFLADYMQLSKHAQSAETLTEFMRNYIEQLQQRLEDKDAFLLAECFFYQFLFLADRCRLSEHLFLTTLSDFVESFGFGVADNLLELCLVKGLKKMEERIRFMYLYYSDDTQLNRLPKDSWSVFTMLYLFLSSSQTPRAKYLKHELLKEAETIQMRNQLQGNQINQKPPWSPENLLIGLLEEEEKRKKNNSAHIPNGVIELAFRELMKRPANKDIVESIFGIYQGMLEARKTSPLAFEFVFIKEVLESMINLIMTRAERNNSVSVNELRVLLALFSNFLASYSEESNKDEELMIMVYENLSELINAENGFTKYIGISVFTNLLLNNIKRKMNDKQAGKNQAFNLVKVCLKGLQSEPDTSLFAFKAINIWPQVASALSRLIDESIGDDRRKLARVQEYLRRVEEEFSSTKGGNNDLNTEVWKFLKKLP